MELPGEKCSYQRHHRQIVEDECNAMPQQRVQWLISRLLLRLLLRRLVVLPATNVVIGEIVIPLISMAAIFKMASYR